MTGVDLGSRLVDVVGDRTAKAFSRAFDIETVRDLLWHFPRRYSNRGELTPITTLPVGEHVTVVAEVVDVRERRMQRRHGDILEVRVTDGEGTLQLTYFNQRWRKNELKAGRQGIFAGKVTEYRGQLQLQHPDYKLYAQESSSSSELAYRSDASSKELELSSEQSMELHQAAALAFSQTPVPIYPAVAALPSWVIADTIELVLKQLEPIDDPLPREIRASEEVMALDPAIRLIHRPERTADWKLAQHSLRFREAFELQLALLDRRRRRGREPGTARESSGDLVDRLDATLLFDLTGDQQRAAATLATELAIPHPMHRLLQGEVGSGKTVVALRAMLQVASGGGQSALLAPTEVLAAQHFRSITETLGPALTAELNPVLLTGRMPAAERKRALLSLASGTSRIAIGTHALISERVTFYDLGFIVVDEQHRFGVEQREALRRKGPQPHVLAMTATPIPRTVALTAFGDLEVTTIKELPPGRLGIETFPVPEFEMPNRAERVWARAAEDIGRGRQVYVVCPAISPGEAEEGERLTEDPEATVASAVRGDAPDQAGSALALRSDGRPARPIANVEDTVAEIRRRPEFAGFVIEGLHGGMASAEKDRIMRAFAAGDIHVLVATTVIEVGINVPNATIMIVRDAERFGISQLHQLRGRVGRGMFPGLCLLMTTAEQGSVARERVEAVAATSDGFDLAEVDLGLRREGDILGTAQSGGKSTLKLLRVTEHGELIQRARAIAADVLRSDPELSASPGLAELLARDATAGRIENLAKS